MHQIKKGAKLQLDLISQFTRDISKQFGSEKCAYLNIERGNQKSLGKFPTLDETKLANNQCYKYLGQDENITYNVLNKQRVMKEYMKRIHKIWSSELYSNNKVIAHNVYHTSFNTYIWYYKMDKARIRTNGCEDQKNLITQQ